MSRNSTPKMHATGTLALERLPQVRVRTCLSKSEIYRRIALGTFPAPVKLGASKGARAIAFVSSEIDAYIADRIAARDGKIAP